MLGALEGSLQSRNAFVKQEVRQEVKKKAPSVLPKEPPVELTSGAGSGGTPKVQRNLNDIPGDSYLEYKRLRNEQLKRSKNF